MPEPLMTFSWSVCSAGHRLVEREGVPWLIESESRNSGSCKETQPLENPALFRKAADLSHLWDPKHVVAFANEHGLLGCTGVHDWIEVDREAYRGEPLHEWQTRLQDLNQAVDLADAIAETNRRLLRSWLCISRGRLRYERPEFGVKGSHAASTMRDEVEALRNGEPRPAAMAMVRRLAEPNLQTYCTFRLEPQDGVLRFALQPQSLLGALWAQWAMSLGSQQIYRRCTICGSWIALSTEGQGKRSHARYCRRACQQKALRMRRADARRLKAKGGLSDSEIARRVGARNARVVRGWVRGPGKNLR
jgi:hypothetical protein